MTIKTYWLKYKDLILISVLIIFHTVGVFGIKSDSRDYFLGLSFMNLMLSFIVLLIAREKHHLKFYLALFSVFSIGIFVEWIGIHTGYLFGNYAYGANLGVKLDGVPLIIGVNWAVLTICSCRLAVVVVKENLFLKSLVSAGLMTALDFLIEPVAIVSDYWTWSGDIPAYNYLCWFIISFVIHIAWFKLKLTEKNKVPLALYSILVIFFVVLNS
ncbi:MAG: carotenoid biosynthesis protein [Lishizhenia sp.]